MGNRAATGRRRERQAVRCLGYLYFAIELISYRYRADLQQYLKPIFLCLLTRMHTNKTDKFTYLFAKFFLYTMAINVEGITPDLIITTVEGIQPQYVIAVGSKYWRLHDLIIFPISSRRLWFQILTNFVAPQAPKFPHKERKLAVVGITCLLCHSTLMLEEPSVRAWYAPSRFPPISQFIANPSSHPPSCRSIVYAALGKLFTERQYLDQKPADAGDATTVIDFEEQAAGYQAAYSRLAASETPEEDPVAYVQNPLQYLQQEIARLTARHGQKVQSLIGAAEGGRIQ